MREATKRTSGWVGVMALALAPMLGGADGCGAAFSESPAPNMAGDWDVSYDDRLDVEIAIGGATYTEELGAGGGVVELTHEGQPLMFDLRCERPEVVCPSEVWPSEVGFRQDDERYPHRVWLQIPHQECMGALRDPAPSECGAGTQNPECEQVCDGAIETSYREAFGVIDEPGESWRVGLGAGFATNGINCVLLGASVAEGDLTTTGTAEDGDWEATATRGDVVTTYGGGCLWAGDPDMDGELEALVLGATVRFATGFAGDKR
ncbi:MAG TPA: hypothetical protein RMH85_10755 [Polyangiaceae bacterium LLY-WYZ-15_(1-7)]|nr:hypothetical protein [Myxococcales bacterium]MBJ73917.1 hypothetical protein [Sandaracinus sp.]HJL00676.1 hypothetical protein [Polyangiaceae bacterium LLY-WYZ-15_(1-7)]HJL08972.1 hypothetical protein [Polyangiaceae bacterium LLY-WYZ-15_(1-7)]HJL21729.1 hypothetical protein [Polyangiaceae bacterium LLY-WYZ-15_(1-7)]